jgi:putative transposase
MPRKARIDAPDTVHDIMARGIERRKIFRNEVDRDDFLGRLEQILTGTRTPCYAWALIPNHFHLLLKNGQQWGASTYLQFLS